MSKAAPTPPQRTHRFHQLTKRLADDSFVVLERHQGGRAVSGTHSKRKRKRLGSNVRRRHIVAARSLTTRAARA